MAVKFERFALWRGGKTWAFVKFREHHTELNQMYWAHAPAAHHAHRHIKLSSSDPATAFNFTREAHRTPKTPNEWSGRFKEFENWTRLSALMSLASYFEIYIRSVVSLALESDPGVQLGRSHAIEGVSLLKSRSDYSFIALAEKCTKGTWQERLSHYRTLFGHVPVQLEAMTGDLEDIRKMRNSVGHMFGRPGDFSLVRDLPDVTPTTRLSETRLQTFLGTVMDAANIIDGHLGPSHVGQYESFIYYHSWRDPNFLDTPEEARRLVKEFSQFKASPAGGRAGREFCRGLIIYYKSA